jgi:hypothetical protein
MNSEGTVIRLTDPSLPTSQRQAALREFAHRFGWRPSDAVEEYPGIESVANGHLVIEHGLDNTAVISFLKTTHSLATLSVEQRIRLLGISYNNLVDWHVFPDREGITTVLNRVQPFSPRRLLVHEAPDIWRAECFERITADHPTPNLKNLDQALIETISIWKRSLAAELSGGLSNDSISTLFNAIFFVRALEDHRRFESTSLSRLLVEEWAKMGPPGTVTECVQRCLQSLGTKPFPSDIIDMSKLSPFDSLDRNTVTLLFRDFYDNRFAPYQYDFSLMSKHALSRIYEKYVTVLRERETDQLTLFADLPEEVADRSLGAIYTPQYIARFFARFLRDNLTPRMFRALRVADPACGSGIFLRTLLEMQCDPFQFEGVIEESIRDAFRNVLGIDWDANACHATRLSLALLHLVLTGEFPESLAVVQSEALEYYEAHAELQRSFGAVVTNPPYIKWDRMGEELRTRVGHFVQGLATGKPDMFLAHLRLGLEMVQPGGFLLYVLPHSFLIAKNAAGLRAEIGKNFWVRSVVDLSDIPVFGGVGSYVVLLIVQRRDGDLAAPAAVIVRCREFIGHALCDALEGKTLSTDFYEVYQAEQRHFSGEQWTLLSPEESRLHVKVRTHRALRDFLTVREGFVSGADEVFIIPREDVPKGERRIYVPFLSDREMDRFRVPEETPNVVFYPYVGDELIEEERLAAEFTKTWDYLCQHRDSLAKRSSVLRGDFPWWRPERPRHPSNLLRPKIVSPHLIVMPRFSLDEGGRYAVSHCPVMYPRERGSEVDLLRFFLAVLNSTVSMWQIVQLSHKYSRGYAMLEPKTLREMAVPDPREIPAKTMRRIQTLVARRLRDPRDTKAELELDDTVADLYGLTESERNLIGMGE